SRPSQPAQALIARVAAEVMRDQGVELDQLINPSKVINLERELAKLRAELAGSGSANGAVREAIKAAVDKKERTLAVEKRAVMRGWLKQVFVGQAALSVVIAGLLVYDAVPFYPNLDLSARVLGFWLIWLFTLPSLRARKPAAAEKDALNFAFLATPLVSLGLPFVTKDPVTIYWANLAATAACYGAAYVGLGSGEGGDDGDDGDGGNMPEWVRFVFKALDFGSGQERGARK
ncbi:unnamed protein product, partial [Phaeothamnion confervicola]